jgi:hypothetical protein
MEKTLIGDKLPGSATLIQSQLIEIVRYCFVQCCGSRANPETIRSADPSFADLVPLGPRDLGWLKNQDLENSGLWERHAW